MKKIILLCLTVILTAFSCSGFTQKKAVTAGILEISKYGNVELDMPGSEFLAHGFAFGDIVTVSFGEHFHDMPVGSSYSDVDDGQMLCRVEINEEEAEDRLVLAINMGDFAASCGIAVKTETTEDPGYRWEYSQEAPVFSFSMKEKAGYAGEYSLRQMNRTNAREDYPHLTDEAFANFRMVSTSGMDKGVLYRSSSPIDPQLGRSGYADKALAAAGVKTVINLADTEMEAKAYPGYDDSAYAGCDAIMLSLGLDVQAEAFEAGFAEGLRFMIDHDGPYLVHCTEGKDRGGFVSAVLESLMGATAQEIISDYMTTYENYYGTLEGSDSYRIIAQSNIKKTLAAVFSVEDIEAPEVDLADEAQTYMIQRLGLTPEEVDALKACLGGTENRKRHGRGHQPRIGVLYATKDAASCAIHA